MMTSNKVAKAEMMRIEENTDWVKLVAMAEANPPAPWELLEWLNHWSREFERSEDGPPLLPDFPEPVQKFFKRIAVATAVGRPCKDEKHVIEIRKAWVNAVFRGLYDQNREMAEIAKEIGIPYNGRLLNGETPSEAVIGDIVDNSPSIEFGVDRLRKIIFPRRRK